MRGAEATAVAAVWMCVTVTGCLPPPTAGPPVVAPRTAPDDSDPWGLVPGDAETVVFADVAQLRESPWTRAAVAAGQDARSARAAVRGFDEVADVDTLVLASAPSTRGTSSLLIARGRFSRDRVVAAFRGARKGAAAAPFRGAPLWTDGQDAIAFVTPRTLLSGPPAAVRAAVDCAYGTARAVIDQEWVARLKGALTEGRGRSGRAAALEVAVSVTADMRQRIRAEIGEVEAVERVGVRVHLGEALDATIVGETPGRDAATQMAGQLGALLRQLRARRSLTALGFGAVLERTRIAAYGARVVAEVQLEDEERSEIAERLGILAEALSGGAAAAPAGD